MQDALNTLDRRLTPIEDLFFTWLFRVVVAATLFGSAWIDDAPPLDLAAFIISLYVAGRVALQFGAFFAAAPFENRVLKAITTVLALLLLGLSFLVVAILMETLTLAATG